MTEGITMTQLKAVQVVIDEQNRGDPRYHQLLDSMWELHCKKVADYGRDTDPLANLRGCSNLGIEPFVGVLVRMSDKMHRLGSFVKNGHLENEGVVDTLKDLAAYSLLAILLLEDEASKENGK